MKERLRYVCVCVCDCTTFEHRPHLVHFWNQNWYTNSFVHCITFIQNGTLLEDSKLFNLMFCNYKTIYGFSYYFVLDFVISYMKIEYTFFEYGTICSGTILVGTIYIEWQPYSSLCMRVRERVMKYGICMRLCVGGVNERVNLQAICYKQSAVCLTAAYK